LTAREAGHVDFSQNYLTPQVYESQGDSASRGRFFAKNPAEGLDNQTNWWYSFSDLVKGDYHGPTGLSSSLTTVPVECSPSVPNL